MNFLPLLVVKKRNLRHHGCRSGFSLNFELGSCQRANFRSYASLPGACPSGQTILQWCFSCLWHALLSCTQWVASWQERNLFRGGCQRWLATLSKAFSSKISLFLALSLCSSVCNSHLCPLLQPTPTQKKIVSCLSFPFDRFPSLSSLATPYQRFHQTVAVELLTLTWYSTPSPSLIPARSPGGHDRKGSARQPSR